LYNMKCRCAGLNLIFKIFDKKTEVRQYLENI
jgi:hypothetical protein